MKSHTDLDLINKIAEFSKKLAQAPGNKFPREAIQNGIEAYQYSDPNTHIPNKSVSVIKVDPDDFYDFSIILNSEGITGKLVPKLAYHNFGTGMNAAKLRKTQNGASSGEEKSMATNKNHGEGATITGLASNKGLGVIYVSCHKGLVSMLWLRVLKEDGYSKPVRHNFYSLLETNTKFSDVVDITQCFDIIKLQHEYPGLFQPTTDWTLAIAMGDSMDQDTGVTPFSTVSRNTTGQGMWLHVELYNRFFNLPTGVVIRMGPGAGQSRLKNAFYTFTSYEQDIINGHNKYPEFKFEWITDDESGIKIGYMYEPASTTPGRRALSTGHSILSYSAIIYENECYSTHGANTGGHKLWKSIAHTCGITVCNDNFKILVKIPTSDDIIPTPWRKDIAYKHDPELQPIDFNYTLPSGEKICDMSKRLMPQWVKDKQKELDTSISDASNIQDLMQQRLDNLLKTQLANAGTTPATGTGPNPPQGGKYGPRINQGTNPTGGTNPIPKSVKASQNGYMHVGLRFPTIKTIVDEKSWSETGDSDLTGRAAWYDTDNELLYINGLYQIIDVHSQLFMDEFQSDIASFDDEIRRISRAAMEERICEQVLYGLAKRSATGWEMDDITAAWNPGALTIGAADREISNEYRKQVKAIKQKLENQPYE